MTQAKLRNRIKILEEDLSNKTEALQKYQVMGNTADEKIQALNKIHNDKIRSLMNSIQMLKKDNAQLLNQGKQHKRSQLIAALNKQISDQDIVIQVIRNYVYKQHGKEQGRAALDGIIVAALTKGPERIRAPTRQQLKIEIENLKVRIQNMKSGNAKINVQQKVILNESDVSNLTIENDREQLFQTLQTLKTSNQKLQIELKSTNKTIQSMKTQLTQHSKLDIEATSLRTEIAIANKKIQTLQTVLKQTKQYNNTKIIQLYQRQIKVQQLQMQSKNSQNKLNLLQQSHSIALQQMNLQIQRLKAELDSINKQNQRMILQNIGMKKTHDSQKGKIEEIRELNIKQKAELGQKLQKYQKQFKRLVYDNDQKNERIINLTQQLNKLKLQMTKLQLQLQQLNQNGVTNQNLQALVQKNNQLQQEIQTLKQLGGDGQGYVPNSLLMDRIRTLEKRIAILQKQLKDNNILSDKQIEALHDQNLFEKYLQLAKQFEKYKLQHKNPKSKKNIHLIQLDEQERQKLKKLDTSLSQLGLRSVQSNAIREYDSDFEFQIVNKKKKSNGLPVISEYDKELMGLITSDLWDFLQQDKVGQMLQQLSDYESKSKYYQKDDLEIEIKQFTNHNLLALQNMSKNMKKGKLIKVHAQQYNKLIDLNSDVSDVKSMRQKDLQEAYNSDIQLEPQQLNLYSILNKKQQLLNLDSHQLVRINNLSSNVSSSIMDASVSLPMSGQSNVNLNTFVKKQRQMKSTNINSKTHKKQSKILHTTQLNRFKNYNSDVSDIQSFRQQQLQVYDSNIRLQQSELPLQSDNDYATNQNISSNSSDTFKQAQMKPNPRVFKKQQSKQNRHKQKASMLIGLYDIQNKNSDYEQPQMLRAKLGFNGCMNSSVSGGSQIDNKALKIINSDISIGSLKKKR